MTHFINKSSTGKTKQLMLLASENNGTVVCSNPDAMRSKCYAYGITNVDFISYYDYLNPDYNARSPFYIDEIESFFVAISASFGSVKGYSLTLEEN